MFVPSVVQQNTSDSISEYLLQVISAQTRIIALKFILKINHENLGSWFSLERFYRKVLHGVGECQCQVEGLFSL